MSRYAAIGWTKLSILAEHSRNHPGKVSARKGLTYAEQCTAKELPAVLDGAPLPEEGKKTHHSIHLRLTPRQYKVFAAAMGEFEATPAGRGFADKERAVTEALTLALKARSTAISTRQS
jgi:hypothetical protein